MIGLLLGLARLTDDARQVVLALIQEQLVPREVLLENLCSRFHVPGIDLHRQSIALGSQQDVADGLQVGGVDVMLSFRRFSNSQFSS